MPLSKGTRFFAKTAKSSEWGIDSRNLNRVDCPQRWVRCLAEIAVKLNHIVTTMHINRRIGILCPGRAASASSFLLALLLAAFAAPSARATVGRDWTTRNPTPTGETIHGVVSNGSKLVAVGGHGLIATSSDGVTWTTQNLGISDLRAVAWSAPGAKFMAVGDNSAAYTSPDGITWTAKPALGADSLVSVVWTGNAFVAVGSTGTVGAAQTTVDGTTWTRTAPGADPVLQVCAVTSSNLFAITGKTIINGTVGSKGLVWAKVTGITGLTAADLPKSMVWTGASFVLCATNGGLPGFYVSTNGKVWNQSGAPPAAAAPLELNFSGSEVIGAGPSGDVWRSVNGAAWTHMATGQNELMLAGARQGATYVVAGQGGRIYSGDGNTWTSRLSSGVVTDIAGAASNGTGFTGVGQNFSLVSTDGTSWTTHPQTDKNMRSAAHTGARWIAVGDGAWASTDGITWTETLPAANSGVLTRVVWTGTQAVAVGLDNSGSGKSQIWTSADGLLWTQATVPATALKKLNGVGYFGGLLVAAGEGGLVVTSPDFGTTWSKFGVVLKKDEHFMDVAFGNNVFVGVTNLGGVWTSASGSKWVNRKAASSGMLKRIIWAGNQFVTVGDGGRELYSFGGLEWVTTNANSSQSLSDLAWSGTTLVTVGSAGAILSSTGGQPQRPTLNFNLASVSVSEGFGTATLNVTLSPASPLPVTVAFSLSGTALQGTSATSDYTVSTLPLKFTPGGPTTLPLAITIKSDALDEVNETAVLTLGAPTGDAGLGSTYSHTLTILDDDQVPTFTAQPVSLLVNAGTSPTLSATVAASGTPGTTLTAQWKKNNGATPGLVPGSSVVTFPAGATFNGTIANIALTHAGAYTVLVKNASGSATSAVAQLGVVENNPQGLNVAADSTTTLQVKAAGNGLSYQWLKDGTPLANSTNLRITGATTSKLMIKEMSLADNGVYSCLVTQTTPVGFNTIIGATTVLGVVVSAPVIAAQTLPSTTIGLPYDYAVQASGSPTLWTVANLPSGLSFNTVTGRITGKVTEPVTTGTDFPNITFTATNLIGAGPPKSFTLHVEPLPANALGTYYGVIERSNVLNKGLDDTDGFGLGGRVQLTIANTGIYTGTITQGGATYPLMSSVTYNPTGPLVEITEVLSGQRVATSTLKLTINPATRTITGSATNAPGGSDVANFTGWRANLWTVSPPSATVLVRRFGKYSMFHTPPTGDPSRPVGHSVLNFEIAETDGIYTATGILADGSQYTQTGVMGPAGEVQVYAGLYTGLPGNVSGSLTGTLTVNELADVIGGYLRNTVTGDLQWNRPKQATDPTADRTYRDGFKGLLLTLSGITATKPNGGRYIPPAFDPPSTATNEYPEFYMGMNATGTNNGRFLVSRIGVDLTDNAAPPPNDGDVQKLNEVFSVKIAPGSEVLVQPGGNVTPPLTIDPNTGRFSGRFNLTNQNPLDPDATVDRIIPFFGTVVRDNVAPSSGALWFGRGSLLVPRLPEAGLPPTNSNTNSPIQSGALQMLRNP